MNGQLELTGSRAIQLASDLANRALDLLDEMDNADEEDTDTVATEGESPSAQLLLVRENVRRVITQLYGQAQIDNDGDLNFHHGSTQMFISVRYAGELIVISLFQYLVKNAKKSAALFKHVATHADDYNFGHLSAFETEDGVWIKFSYTILGDNLVVEDLGKVVELMAWLGDKLDDELVEQFGGEVWAPWNQAR